MAKSFLLSNGKFVKLGSGSGFGEAKNLRKHKVGGRIFYDDGDNGVIYTFYDINNNIITDTSISGLANAVEYTAEGMSTKERFYVFDNTSHITGGKTAVNGLVSNLFWGYSLIATNTPDNSIGSGKINTNKILAIEDTSEYPDSIFKYIKACRDEKLNECNDWFVASKAEQDKLIASKLVNWYDSEFLWASVDHNGTRDSYYWRYYYNRWDYTAKNTSFCCFAARSF